MGVSERFLFVGIALASIEASAIEFNALDRYIDAPYSTALSGAIEDGMLVSKHSDEKLLLQEISEQLRYTVGHLNYYGSVASLMQTADDGIVIKQVDANQDGSFTIQYNAHMTVAWSNRYQAPSGMQLVLPRGVQRGSEYEGRLYKQYANRACLDSSTHDLDISNFWYYWRPTAPSCPLQYSNATEDVVRPYVKFSRSPATTTGKSPEYKSLWRDGVLKVLVVFSKERDQNPSPNDPGAQQYGLFWKTLFRYLGNPSSATQPITGMKSYRAQFRTNAGPVEVTSILADTVYGMPEHARTVYSAISKDADLVLYSGHAGHGANIEAIVSMLQPNPGQYQLLLLNGCDTFAYVGKNIGAKYQAINPEGTPFNFVDVIANATPSYFHYGASTSVEVIFASMNARDTYFSLMSRFDSRQHPIVFGEEDND